MKYSLRSLMIVVTLGLLLFLACAYFIAQGVYQESEIHLETRQEQGRSGGEARFLSRAPSDADRYKKALADATHSVLTYGAFFNEKPLSATVNGKQFELLRQSLQPIGDGRKLGKSRPTADVVTTIVLTNELSQTTAEIVVTDRLAYLNLDGIWVAFPLEEVRIQRMISRVFHLKQPTIPGSPFDEPTSSPPD